MNPDQIASLVDNIAWERFGAAGGIIFFTWLIARFVTSLLTRLGDRLTNQRLRISQAVAFSRFSLYFVGILLAAFTVLRLDGASKTAVVVAIGFAASLAFQDLARTVVAGVTILIDRPFQVGDRINVDGVYGEVQHIGLRSVKMTTLDDNLVTIPNSKFVSDLVSSANAGALHMLVQSDFFIGIDEDVGRARELVAEAMTSSRFFALNHPWVVLVNQVVHGEYFAVRLRAKGYVLDIHYEKAFETDVTLRVMEAFKANKIGPPVRLSQERPV